MFVATHGYDFCEWPLVLLTVKVADPQFEGLMKTKLGNSEIMEPVQSVVVEKLVHYLKITARS